VQERAQITLFYELYLKSINPVLAHKRCKVVFTSLEKQYLCGELFPGSNLDGVDFSGADLRRARFKGASLCGCDFSGADLRETVFWDCDLRSARFDCAIFGDNSFKGSCLNGAEGITRSLFEYIRENGGHFAYC
jgi:uncharacterized protein YjbI with pentapeptide repeats